ncbi:MAG: hypothetical protein RIC55_26555 [Pirellulaceae bacterium]
MPESFDPYHTWLGIRPEQQPADHYRLLGLHAYEDDPTVIENAADQRMIYLRTLRAGRHAQYSEKLLNEVTAAKLCLLDGQSKATYDAELRRKTMPTATAPSARPPALPTGPPALNVSAVEVPLPGPPEMRSVPQVVGRSPQGGLHRAQILGIACAIGGVVVLGTVALAAIGGLYWMHRTNDEQVAHRAVSPAVVETPLTEVLPESDGEVGEDTSGSETADASSPPETVTNETPASQATSVEPEATVGSEPTDGGSLPEVTSSESDSDTPEEASTEATAPSLTTTTPSEAAERIRQPIPNEDVRQTIAAKIEELYPASDYELPSQQVELARTLLQLGDETRDRPNEQFVFYHRAMETACSAGEAELMLSAIDAIGMYFDFDQHAVKVAMLERFVGEGDEPARILALLKSSQEVAAAAMAEGHYQSALRISLAATRFCDRPLGSSEFRDSIRHQHTRIEQTFREFQQFEQAQKTLALTSDDAAANLAAGRWYCFVRNDWKRGLSHLVQSSDERLKALASAEQNVVANDVDSMIALGDSWWGLVESAGPAEKRALATRARHWYDRAASHPLSGIKKLAVEKRQGEIAALVDSLQPLTWDFTAGAPSSDDAESKTTDDAFVTLFSSGLNSAVQSHDFGAAERSFAHCERLRGEHVPTLNNYALTLVRGRSFGQAINLWNKAAELGPPTRELRHNVERFRRLTSTDGFSLSSAQSRSLDELCDKVASRDGYVDGTAWLYMPLDSAASRSSYEDDRCMYCAGTGKADCPVRQCARGTIPTKTTESVGVNTITGQPILKTVTIRVPCRACGASGDVDCPHCYDGKDRSSR